MWRKTSRWLGMALVCLTFLAPMDAKAAKPKIVIYEGLMLDRPFVVVGKVNAKADSFRRLKKRVLKLARRHGGDAVLGYRVENRAIPSLWSGAQISYAEGVVIRFSEGGLREIRPETPVPVLE